MFLVSERCFVSSPSTGSESARRGIVLDDVVVPVDQPHGAIRSHFAINRGRPFIITGGKVARIVRDEIRSASFEIKLSQQVTGRFGHELDAVPILPGERPRRVNATARTRCITAVK